MGRNRKQRVKRDTCKLCKKKVRITKMKKLPFKSLREGVGEFFLDVCGPCYDKDMAARKTGASDLIEESITKERPKPAPTPTVLRKTPHPQSTQSDKRPQGFVHTKGYGIEIPIGEQEHGKLTIDAARLSNNTQHMLGAALMAVVRDMANHKCFEITVKSIRFEYKCRLPK